MMKLIMEEFSHSHTHHFGFFFRLISTIILFSSSGYANPCLPNNPSSSALFVFGSSVFDVGNNNYINTTTSVQANFSPYGETFFRYPTGRFSNGRLIPDFIAEYAKLPLRLPYLFSGYQSYIDGANFASAAAGALNQTNQRLRVIPLKAQLGHLREVRNALRQRSSDFLGHNGLKDAARLLLSKAVYLFNIGTNDYTARYVGNSSEFSSSTREEYIDMVIGNMTDVIKEIYSYGGRKFGILGLGNLGCFPAARFQKAINGKSSAGSVGSSCSEEDSDYARMHNTKLIWALNKFHKELQGFKYSYTSFYDLINDMMDHPSKYGFKEGIVACCGSGPFRGSNSCGGKRGIKEYELCENPNEFVFFDNAHPTERTYQYFARQMWSGNSNLTWPYNLKTLLNFEDTL